MMARRKHHSQKPKSRYDTHHIIPKSRGGEHGKTIELPIHFHQAWHEIFGNLYGQETLEMLLWILNQFQYRQTLSEEDIERARTFIKERR